MHLDLQEKVMSKQVKIYGISPTLTAGDIVCSDKHGKIVKLKKEYTRCSQCSKFASPMGYGTKCCNAHTTQRVHFPIGVVMSVNNDGSAWVQLENIIH
jgi:hypothetical protein